ncbi:uncharacterized protein [Solanum lycopersicum]|uniref:uncharacterized protein n=1 Tax=Solanum lycopersicum TaxID=4081 RepID=UPI0002BCB76B|nr:uncharacterized protein LOC101268438 [Solanum lycopersicum]
MKQKAQKFKPELSSKIKEEITKQIESRLMKLTQYLTWLANVVPVAKKDGKIRIRVNYRDLNEASPKDNFPLPNIHILIDTWLGMKCSHLWIVTTSTGATPYLLVYGTEAVIPAEVEIPSLRIIQEAELSNAEWVGKRIDQLTLIDEKRMVVVCHGQIYRQIMIRVFHKRVRARIFEVSKLVLKRIFPHQDEYKEKFASNWQGP